MELILVRHAQPAWVIDDKSVLDPPLTELGREQARILGEHVREWSAPTELLVSPTKRTRQTAEPLAEALNTEIEICPWLEEIRLPSAWDGAPATRIGKILRGARSRPEPDWWAGIGEDAEAFQDFYERVTGGLRSELEGRGVGHREAAPPHRFVLDASPEHRLLFVGHGGSNAVIVSFLLGLVPVPWEWERFALMHTAVTRVKIQPVAQGYIFALRLFGGVEHLPKPLRSR